MRILYYRYNKQSRNKYLREKEKYESEYDEIIGVPVTSGRKLLKKEIRAIEELFETKKPSQLDIFYLNPQEIEKLPPKIAKKVNVISGKREKAPAHKLKVFLHILKEMKKRGEICLERDFPLFAGYSNLQTKQSFFNYMEQLKNLFDPLIVKNREKEGNCYKLQDMENVITEVIEKVEDMEELALLLTVLPESGIKNFSDSLKGEIYKNREVITIKNRPVEKLTPYTQQMLKDFKRAILERRYIDIWDYKIRAPEAGYDAGKYLNVIPLQLIFMNNNWYLAGVVKVWGEDVVKFFRLSFIGGYKIKEPYPPLENREKFLKFLKKFETPFTLYGEKWKKAHFRVHPSKVPYFLHKEIFPKQKILDNREENFVIEVGYTQPLEILPTIRQWIPFVEVIWSEDGTIEQQLKRELGQYLLTIPQPGGEPYTPPAQPEGRVSPRKRGRPKKNREAEKVKENTPSSIGEDEKKEGKVDKNGKNGEKRGEEKDKKSDSTPPKRKRGRPRKDKK